MLSGKVLDIYRKYVEIAESYGCSEHDIDYSIAHIVWSDGNCEFRSIDWALKQDVENAMDALGYMSLIELRKLPEDEIKRGFASHFNHVRIGK